MPFTDAAEKLTVDEKQALLAAARASVEYGLHHCEPLPIGIWDYSCRLQLPGACFVTLEIDGTLRGCIGSLEPTYPLIQDVARNAFQAAFQDPRFPPVTREEFGNLDLHVSILGAPQLLDVHSEAELARELVPGQDGLILQDGHTRATYLPSVWSKLPEPAEFVRHLKKKAGWTRDDWSPTLQAFRYHVEELPPTQ